MRVPRSSGIRHLTAGFVDEPVILVQAAERCQTPGWPVTPGKPTFLTTSDQGLILRTTAKRRGK